jgi:hypothetical protein
MAKARAAVQCNSADSRSSGEASRQTTLPASEGDAFRRLQGDAVLSRWKPHVTLATDIPDIPDFLRREERSEQEKAA